MRFPYSPAISIVCIAFSCVRCGSVPPIPEHNIYAPQELSPYIEKAKKACPAAVRSTTFRFMDSIDGSKFIGYCSTPQVIVVLQRPYWEKASEDARLSLVLHELGHCWLNLKHTEDANNFMYPWLRVSDDTLEQFQKACT